jgi:titin
VTTGGNPDAPTLTATAVDRRSIRLSWNVPNNNGTPITGYDLRRWDPDLDNDDGAWEGDNLIAAGVTVTEFVDTDGADGLEAGTKYYYRIRAVPQNVDTNNAGEDEGRADEGWSAEDPDDAKVASATTHGEVPSVPQGFEAEVDGTTNTTINVMWTAPEDSGGSDITGYELRIWDSATSQWVAEATPAAADTSYPDEGLANGTTYYYILRAMNDDGPGPWTTYTSAPTGNATADAPELTATPASTTSIRLTWPVPNNNGADVTGYMLQRWEPDANGGANWGDAVTITGADQTLFLDTNLMPGTTYYYRMLTDATATEDSGYSTVVNAKTVEAAPGRPQSVTATADGENAIDISWAAPMSNGGNAIVHYRIEMWNSSSKSWTHVTTLAAAHTSYKHRGRTADTRYVYRVRAENRAPTNNGLGPWSTITSATTDPADE